VHPTQMKIFGFVICPTLYQETVTKPGIELYEDLRKCCFHGNPGSLTVEVAKIFALSKLYYVAQVLPLPDKQRRRVESCLSKFIFIGRQERLKLSELENRPMQGGLGLPGRIPVKHWSGRKLSRAC
jgi:hypothetical protein